MDKKFLDLLNTNYKFACNDILRAFAREYDVQVTDKDWVGDIVGGIASVNEEYFMSLEEMLLMLNNNVSWTDFLAWWDYNADCKYFGLNTMNLQSWIKGAPRYPQEKIEGLKAIHKEITELMEETTKDLEGY